MKISYWVISSTFLPAWKDDPFGKCQHASLLSSLHLFLANGETRNTEGCKGSQGVFLLGSLLASSPRAVSVPSPITRDLSRQSPLPDASFPGSNQPFFVLNAGFWFLFTWLCKWKLCKNFPRIILFQISPCILIGPGLSNILFFSDFC